MSLSTGYKSLDKMLGGGFIKGKLYVLAARPCMGKTGFVLNVLNNICQKKNKTAILFSTEAGRCLTMARLLSIDCGIDPWKIQNFHMQEGEWDELKRAALKRNRQNLIIDDTDRIILNHIASRCVDILDLDREKISLVVIDHLKLLAKEDKSKKREADFILEKLKEMAENLDIPILVVSQLTNELESRDDRRPILSDLCEQMAVEKYADVVLFLYRDHYYNSDMEDSLTEVIVAKNTTCGCGTIELTYDPDVVKFEELQEVV